MRIMGIDPGSRNLGLGCIERKGSKITLIGAGTSNVLHDNWTTRLKLIFEAVQRAYNEWKPDAVAVESVFHARNAQSALKLGQARGAAIAAVTVFDVPVFEYAAREIKQAVTGSGGANKEQVQKMLGLILGAQVRFPTHDASDAVAIAICHAQQARFSEARNQSNRLSRPEQSR